MKGDFKRTRLSLLLILSFAGIIVQILPLTLEDPVPVVQAPLRVGIVGAGLGGTATAYYLRKLFGSDVKIDVFERGEVGGRLRTITIGEHVYECGATILHPENQLMRNLTRKFGLEPAWRNALNKSGYAVFDAEKVIIQKSEYRLVNLWRFYWRYGMDLYYISREVDLLLKDFARIYQHQAHGYAFTGVRNLLSAMSPRMLELADTYTAQYLLQQGYSLNFVNELTRAALRTNYNQEPTVQAFVGLVSLAGVQPGLWMVKGGNKRVAENLLESSRATLIAASVEKLTLEPSAKISLSISEKGATVRDNETSTKSTEPYDVVILAAPVSSDLSFEGFPSESAPPKAERFQKVYATLVQGRPNAKKFGLDPNAQFPSILLTSNAHLYFSSIGKQYPIDYGPDHAYDRQTAVWKVFSRQKLSESRLDELFESRERVEVCNWLAYPRYGAKAELGEFNLASNLYYLNAYEQAASAMEMAVISARNVAQLIYNRQKEKFAKIDPSARTLGYPGRKSEVKSEL